MKITWNKAELSSRITCFAPCLGVSLRVSSPTMSASVSSGIETSAKLSWISHRLFEYFYLQSYSRGFYVFLWFYLLCYFIVFLQRGGFGLEVEEKIHLSRESEYNGLFITLIPKFYNNVFFFVGLTTFMILVKLIGWFI